MNSRQREMKWFKKIELNNLFANCTFSCTLTCMNVAKDKTFDLNHGITCDNCCFHS